MVSEITDSRRTTVKVPHIAGGARFISRETVSRETGLDLPLFAVRFPFVLMLLSGLMLADGLISDFMVNSGMAAEGNPFMQGPLAGGYFLPLKIIAAWLCTLGLSIVYRRNPRLAAAIAWAFIGVYTITVYLNIGGYIANLWY